MSSARREFIDWLHDWTRAYPEDMFAPLDMRDVLRDVRPYSHAEAMDIGQRAAAAMARHVLTRVIGKAGELLEGEQTCRRCGCANDCGCGEDCHWVEPDLCSVCAGGDK